VRRWQWRVILNELLTSCCLLFALLSGGAPESRAQHAGARPGWNLPPDRFVSVGGHRLHYFDQGSGPAIVLLHGFSGSAGLEWGRVSDALAVSHRVVAPHQLGFAPSDVPDLPYDTDTFIELLAGLIRALEPGRRVFADPEAQAEAAAFVGGRPIPDHEPTR